MVRRSTRRTLVNQKPVEEDSPVANNESQPTPSPSLLPSAQPASPKRPRPKLAQPAIVGGDETEVEDDSDTDPVSTNLATQESPRHAGSLASFTTADLNAPRNYTSPYAASYFAAPQVIPSAPGSTSTKRAPSRRGKRKSLENGSEDDTAQNTSIPFGRILHAGTTGKGDGVSSGALTLSHSTDVRVNTLLESLDSLATPPAVQQESGTHRNGKATNKRKPKADLGAQGAQVNNALKPPTKEQRNSSGTVTQPAVTTALDNRPRRNGSGTYARKSKAPAAETADHPLGPQSSKQSSTPSSQTQVANSAGKRVRKPSAKAATASRLANDQSISPPDVVADQVESSVEVTIETTAIKANAESGTTRHFPQQLLPTTDNNNTNLCGNLPQDTAELQPSVDGHVDSPSVQASTSPSSQQVALSTVVDQSLSNESMQPQTARKSERKRKRSSGPASKSADSDISKPKRLAVDAVIAIDPPLVVDPLRIVDTAPALDPPAIDLVTSTSIHSSDSINEVSNRQANRFLPDSPLSVGDAPVDENLPAVPAVVPPKKVSSKRKRVTKSIDANQAPSSKKQATKPNQSQDGFNGKGPSNVLLQNGTVSRAQMHAGHSMVSGTFSASDPDIMHEPQELPANSAGQETTMMPEIRNPQLEASESITNRIQNTAAISIDSRLVDGQLTRSPQHVVQLLVAAQTQDVQAIPISQKPSLSNPLATAAHQSTKPTLVLKFTLPSASLQAVSERPEPKFTQASIGWANRRRIAAELTDKLEEAIKIPIFQGTCRLACANQHLPGNLILSADRATLEFWELNQHPPQVPMFSTRTSDIEKDPTVSPRGANPITLRFKCGDTWKGPGQIMVFIVSQTAAGYTEMQTFREQVVLARATFPYQREATPEGAETYVPTSKKYLCEKCQSRFKNKNGLEYHLEKSQTACNPNFDFVAKPPKERKVYVRKVNVERNAENESVRPKRIRKARGEVSDENEGDKDGNNSESSVDSIYKWAQKVADKNTTETSTTTRKKYKAYNGEAEAFQVLANTPNAELYPLTESAEVVAEPVNPIGITPAFCSEMIVEMIEKNGGIFSSDKGIWFAIVNAWLLNYKTIELPPGSKMCFKALDDLVDAGKLQKINFVFRDKKSRDVPRNMFMTTDYSGGEEAVVAVKAAVASNHPAIYVPEAFAPPPKAFAELQNLVTRVFNKPAASPVVHEDIESSDSEAEFDSEDDSEEDDMSIDGEPDDVSEELDGELADEDGLQTKRKRRKGTKGGRGSKNISKGVIAWHVRRRAAGLEGPLTKRTIRRHELLAGAPTERELARRKAQKEKPSAIMSGAWNAPQAVFLQNPRTGTWSARPVKHNPRIEASRVRARDIGVGIAEPITYLQNETGAWSDRAFGHGVKPIFARPSKRQTMSSYLKTLGKSFRPVLIPEQYVEQEQKRQEELDKYREEKLQRSQRSARKKKVVKHHTSFDFFDDNSADDDFVPGDEEQDDDIREGSAVETQSSGDSDNEHSRNPKTYFFNPSARLNRTRIQKRQEPHEVDYEGHELEQLSQTRRSYMPDNPGLDTLPTFYGLEQDSGVQNEADANFETYTKIKLLTPQIVTYATSFEDGSWTLKEPLTSASDQYGSIRFDGRTRFDVENLLYYAYERMEEDDLPEDELDAKRVRLTDQLQRINPHNVHMVSTAKNNRIARIKRLIPTRALTAIEADLDGLTEYPVEVAESMGVEMLPATSGEYARKRLRLGNKMSSAEVTRFLVAIVVIRTLTGGIDQFVDWIIVQTLFPEFSLNYLDKVWRNAVRYKEKEELIDELGIDFQDAYLVAYKHGKVDKLDYDNLLQHDWAKLVMWTMKTLDTSFAPKVHKLTAKRSDMPEEYDSTVKVRDANEPQTMYFHTTAPIYRRLDAAASSASTLNVDAERIAKSRLGHDIVLESWARAAALTPVELWNSKLAFVKLTKYSNDHLESAITTLVEKKVIIKRQRQRWTTGRAYEGSDVFITPLRKPLAGDMVAEAAKYKKTLDGAFLRGEVVDVDYLGDDGSYMCVSHLQACGHIFITEYDVPMDPMGLGDDLHPYDTKRLPKSKIRWKMSMQATPSYLFDEDNRHLAVLQTSAAPLPDDSAALPVWYTILGEIFPEMWKRVVCAVSATIVQRTGISTKSLGIVFTPTLELWELQLLLQWGHEVGLWQPIDDDSDSNDAERVDGWCSTTHWWVLLGVIVKDMDAATAQQKARYETLKTEKERAKSAIGDPEADDSAEPEAMDVDETMLDGNEGPAPDIEHDDVHITAAASNEQEFLAARMFAGRVKVAFEDVGLDSRIQVEGPRELGKARGETSKDVS